MDWQALEAGMPRDDDLPPRARRIAALRRVLEGRQYDHISTPFSEEVSSGAMGEYIPLSKRRPSVRSGLCRVVVDDTVGLVFGDGRFPGIELDDQTTQDAVAAFIKAVRLAEIMSAAAVSGSVGSVALRFRTLGMKPRLDVMPTEHLTPAWDERNDPDVLLSVTEQYKLARKEVLARGYKISAEDEQANWFWFRRVWTATEEQWFLPWPVSARDREPVLDVDMTVVHNLGFVPVIWVRNLAGGTDPADGACTFEPAIDTVIEIDYQLSQSGRALKYAADPKLIIRDAGTGGDGGDRPITGGAANAIVLSDPQADAKLLEINGTAATAVLDHVRALRNTALEATGGSRVDPEKLSAAQSGRAMEILMRPTIQLADRLRTAYGEGGLIPLLRMLIAASRKAPLLIGGTTYRDLDDAGLALVWPRWFPSTSEDRQADATTAKTLAEAGILSRRTILTNLASDYDVEDIDAEEAAARADMDAAAARDASAKASMKEPSAAKA